MLVRFFFFFPLSLQQLTWIFKMLKTIDMLCALLKIIQVVKCLLVSDC